MNQPTTTERVLSALAYLSILFCPVILPLIIWIVDAQDQYVARHAKGAFWTQLFPAVYIIFALLLFFTLGATGLDQFKTSSGWIGGILLTFALLISLILYIYNLAMGISVLLKRQ